jgi:hypothetical protein
MEAICSSETSVDTQRTIRCYSPEVDALPNSSWWKSPVSNLGKMCVTVYGKANLWPYINQALLWTSTAENWNYRQLFVEVLCVEL